MRHHARSKLSTFALSAAALSFSLCGALQAKPEGPSVTRPPKLDYRGGPGAVKGGPSYDHPLMWRAQCDKGVSFQMVGTMHIPDARFAQLSPRLLELIDEADAVYGELDLSDKAALTAQLTPRMMLPSGQTLSSKLPAELYSSLKLYLEEKGSSLAMFGMMKPEAIEILLPMIELMPLLAQGLPNLDEVILQRASQAGKEVGGIETVEEQIQSLFSKSEEESIESLQHTLRRLRALQARGEPPHQRLMRAFFSGDESRLLKEIMSELEGAPPSQLKLFDRLLRQRNHRMAERILKKVKQAGKRVHLFAFGAAHFIGHDSINSLIKKRGCDVKRID